MYKYKKKVFFSEEQKFAKKKNSNSLYSKFKIVYIKFTNVEKNYSKQL